MCFWIHLLWRGTGCAQPSPDAFANLLPVIVQELGVPRVVWSGTGEVCKATERDCMGNAVVAPFHHLAGEGSFRHHLVALLALDGGLALCVGVHGSPNAGAEPCFAINVSLIPFQKSKARAFLRTQVKHVQ